MSKVEPSKPRRRMRILVVDDNVDLAQAMRTLLTQAGHEVQIAHDGPQGIAVALSQRPEIVLLDIGLPGLDGYQVATRLRQEAPCKDAVIIAMTCYGREEDRRRASEANINHYLVKPVELARLLTLISRSSPALSGGGEGKRAVTNIGERKSDIAGRSSEGDKASGTEGDEASGTDCSEFD